MNQCVMLKRPATHLLRATSRFLHGRFATPVLNGATTITDTESTRILGHTSILLQDGLDIRELPMVIRRMQECEFASVLTGNIFEKPSDQDESFQLHLQDCNTVAQVVKLLEIPGDQVSIFSAAYALIRLSQLQDGNATDCDTFIRKAVFKELCDIAVSDVEKVDNDTLIRLVKCYLKSENHSLNFVQSINQEIERRIGSGILKFENLCLLIEYLSSSIKSDMDLLRNTWIHLGGRYREIDETNIAKVFHVFKNISKNQKYIFNLLDKRIQLVWWKLLPSDMAVICNSMNHVGMKSTFLFKSIPKWLMCNIQEVSEKTFTEILSTYINANVENRNFIETLERYVTARIDKLSKKFIAMSMLYCYKVRFLAPKLMDSISEDFVSNNTQYSTIDLYHTIRTYGYLNYSPSNSDLFFTCVDKVLLEQFYNFDPSQIIELLASFTYIKRFPINFLHYVFNASFLSKLRNDKHAQKFLSELYIAVLLEIPVQPPSYIDFLYIDNKLLKKENDMQWHYFHREIGKILHKVKDSDYFQDGDQFSSYYPINYTFTVDKLGNIVKPKLADDKDKKVAIVAIMPNQICCNDRHMLGSLSMRSRHLELIGFSVIEMHYADFMWSCKTEIERMQMLKALLKDHLK